MTDEDLTRAAAAAVLDAQPIANALSDWVAKAAGPNWGLRLGAALRALAMITDRETAEEAEDVVYAIPEVPGGTVTGLFEHVARRQQHPSVGGYPSSGRDVADLAQPPSGPAPGADDCSPYGIERTRLAAEELRSDRFMGRYHAPDRGA